MAYAPPCTLWAPSCHELSKQLPAPVVPGGLRCLLRPVGPKLLTTESVTLPEDNFPCPLCWVWPSGSPYALWTPSYNEQAGAPCTL